jgi:CheY-like chemotaxis protein
VPAHTYSGKNILVIEDDLATREGLILVLETAGCHVRGATNGLEALRLLHEGPRPDLILLDLRMPVLDGWQFRHQQQSDPSLAAIPVVVVSAASDLKQQQTDLAAAAVVTKPFQFDSLLDVVGGLVTPCEPGILVVDDEPMVRQLLKLALEHHGLTVLLASDGREAVETYRLHCDQIGAVLLDVQMPNLDGPHTLDAIQQINPEVRCCFMSGYTGAYSAEDLLGRGALHIFQKPFGLGELAATLRKLLKTEAVRIS